MYVCMYVAVGKIRTSRFAQMDKGPGRIDHGGLVASHHVSMYARGHGSDLAEISLRTFQ